MATTPVSITDFGAYVMNIQNMFLNEFSASIAAGNLHTRDEVAKLRYHVFCQEFEFEPANKQQRELDHCDDYAEFALIKSARDQQAAGCLRVIMPKHDDQLLPMEQHCRQAIERSHFNLAGLPREEICEVSRLAVHADFRGDSLKNRSMSASQKKKTNQYASLVSVSLLAMAAMIAQKHGRQHVLSMMEPRLARGLRLGGIPVKQAGDVVEYHGKRAPFYVTADDMLSGIAWKHPDLIETIEQQVGTRQRRQPIFQPILTMQPAFGALAC